MIENGEVVIGSRQLDDVVVARIAGCRALFDDRVIRTAREKFSRLALTPRMHRLLIDFRDVTQFGSALLAVLIDLGATIQREGRKSRPVRIGHASGASFSRDQARPKVFHLCG